MPEKIVYLCYALEDEIFVNELKDRLIQSKYSVDYLPRDAPDTEDNRQLAKSKIDAAESVIIVISNALYASRQCCGEVIYASEQEKRMVPLAWYKVDDKEVERLYNPSSVSWSAFQADYRAAKDKIGAINWIDFQDYRTVKDNKRFNLYYGILENTLSGQTVAFNAFISYSRKNVDLVKQFKSQLEGTEYKVWFDANNIPRAKLWLDEIKAGIDQSSNCLLFVSSSWLGSDNCDDEYEHALSRSKRLIPIFIAEPQVVNSQLTWVAPNAESALTVFSSRGRWQKRPNDSDEDMRRHFEKQLRSLESANPIIVPDTYLMESPPHIRNEFFHESGEMKEIIARLNADSDYITKHTQLLVRAARHQQGQDELLTLGEWWSAWSWLRDGNRYSPAPSDLHREYIRKSIRRIGVTWAAILTFILVIALIVLTVINGLKVSAAQAEANAAVAVADAAQVRANLAEQQVQSQKVLNTEISNRLQTVVQSSQKTLVNVSGSPRHSVLEGSNLWVSLDHTVQQIRLDGTHVGSPIEVGSDPQPPLFDGRYVWGVSQGEGQITRIDPLNGQASAPISVGADPDRPLVSGDWLWVLSRVSHAFIQINRSSGEKVGQVELSPDERTAVAGGGYLWTWDDNQLKRINAANPKDIVTSKAFGEIQSLTFAGDSLWLAAGNTLYRVNANLQEKKVASVTSKVEAPLVVGDTAWAIARDENRVYEFDTDTLAVRRTFDAPAPNSLFYTENRLWVFTGQDALLIFDTTTGQQILPVLHLPGSNRVEQPVSDGENLWVAPADQGNVSVIRLSDGTLYREFQPCEGRVLSPVYDGGSMWFACPDSGQIISMPASVYYFGQRTIQADTHDEQPVQRGQFIWITQEATGRLLVYDLTTRQGKTLEDFEGSLLPLIDDTHYLWTAIKETGEIIRIDPAAFTFDASASSAYIQRHALNHSVYALNLDVGSVVWALHDDTNSGTPNYSIVNRESLETLAQKRLGLVSSGMTYAGDYVWMPVSMMDKGEIYRIDAKTGLNAQKIEIPDTKYGVWPALQVGTDLWFSVVVAPTVEMIPQLMGMLKPGASIDSSPFSVRQFNPQSMTWGELWPLPGPTAGALSDGDKYLWYTLLSAPSVPLVGQQTSGVGKFVLNLTDGTRLPAEPNGWTFCQYTEPTTGKTLFGTTGSMYLFSDLIYSGCLDNSRDVAVFSRVSPGLLTVHHNVGLYPWQPVSNGDYVWMTFRDSDNAALFDAHTGDLLRVIGLQNSPVPPLIVGDSVWVYDSGDDILQRISLRPT